MMRMITQMTSAPNSTRPFFACHCTSGSSFFVSSGMRQRMPRYESTSMIVRSELGAGAPPYGGGGGGGGGVYEPPPGGGGVAGGTVGGGISLIPSPCSADYRIASILTELFAPSGETFFCGEKRKHRERDRRSDPGHDGQHDRDVALHSEHVPQEIRHHRPRHQQHDRADVEQRNRHVGEAAEREADLQRILRGEVGRERAH